MILKNEYFILFSIYKRLKSIVSDVLNAMMQQKLKKGNHWINTGDRGESVRDHGEWADDRGEFVRDHGEWADDRGEFVRDHGEWVDDHGEFVRDHGEWADDRGEFVRDHGEWADDRGEFVRDRRPNQRGPPVNTGNRSTIGFNGKN